MFSEKPHTDGGQDNFTATEPDGKAFFKISLFKNKKDTDPQAVSRSWQELCNKFRNPQIRKAKDGLLFSPATFEPAKRCNENVKELSLVGLDYDHATEFDDLCERSRSIDCAFLVHTTHSHLRKTESNPDGEARFRVVIPLALPVPAKDFLNVWQWIVKKIGLPVDESKKGVASMFYAPAKADDAAPYNCFVESGAFFDWRKISLETDAKTENERAAKNDKLDDFLSKLRNVKQTGANQWTACCPSHDDRTPSLSITIGIGGKILVHCHSDKGCDHKSIFAAVGMNGKQAENKTTANEPLTPLSVVCVADAVTKEIKYLWKPRIARGMLTMMSGAEGIGKSWLTCVLAAGKSTGNGFPVIDESGNLIFEKCEPGKVLMISAEDSLSQIIKPRLESVGANTKLIFVVDEPFVFDEKGFLKLRALIDDLGIDLVIIDPVFAFTPAKVDINAANQSRAISKELAAIAEEMNTAFILVRHIGKAKGNGDSRAAGLGSIDWRAAVRSELIVGTNPENEAERVIVHDKCNYAPKAEAISYTIENTTEGAQFRWLGKSNVTASALLGNIKSDDEKAEQSEAVTFLREVLRDGEKYSKDVTNEAKQNGISERTLFRVKQSLNIKSRKEGFKPAKWFWRLPEDCQTESEDFHNKENGNLRTNEENKSGSDNDLTEDCQEKQAGNIQDNLRPSDGKLFDPAPERGEADDQANQTPLYYTFPCWNCDGTVSNQDSSCPNCDQDLNEPPF